MIITIPTKDRKDRQITCEYLPDRWKEKSLLVIPYGELHNFTNVDFSLIETPQGVNGISATRQWIIKAFPNKKVFMMDDDLHFHHREKGKLVKSTPTDVGKALDLMDKWLDEGIKCVGFTSRFGNNWIEGEYVECWRPCMAYGFHTSIFEEINERFDDVKVCEDYHIFLSILRQGFKNRMTALYTVTSPSVNRNGGCSSYRNKRTVERSMEKLIQYHSPYISKRKTKGDTQGFDIGYELSVKWKKAYEEGKKLKEIKNEFREYC